MTYTLNYSQMTMNYTVRGISIKVDWCATGDKNHGDDDIAIPIAVAI